MKPKIKYVKKAKQWVVSSWTEGKDKHTKQEEKWFSLEWEAREYFNKLNSSLI